MKDIGYRQLGDRLVAEVSAAEIQLQALKPRWDRHFKLYAADPESSWANRVDGLTAYGVSLWRGKCDRIVGDVVGGIFATSPYVQVTDSGGSGEGTERDLTVLLENAGVSEAFARMTFMAANTNLGAARIRPVVQRGRVVRLEAEWFDPRHFIVYPPNIDRLSDAKTHGHRFYLRLSEVQARQKRGEWYAGDVAGGADPDSETRLDGLFDRSSGLMEVETQDGFTEILELITHTETGERVMATLARATGTVLKVQPWPEAYGPTWYTIVRMLRTERRIYGSDSVAGGVQGLCVMHGDLFNATAGGFYHSAYPIVVREGYVGPAAKCYTPGEIMDVPQGTKVYSIPIQFDFSKALALLDRIELAVEQTLGVSRLATGGAVNPNTKATAIQAMLSSDTRRQAGYQDAAAEALEELAEVALRLYRVHRADLRDAFRSALSASDEALDAPMRLVAASRSVGDPKAHLQKLMGFLELASNPESPYDLRKVVERVAAAFDLPFDPTSVLKDDETLLHDLSTELRKQGIDPLALMAEVGQTLLGGNFEPNDFTSPDGRPLPHSGMATGEQGDRFAPPAFAGGAVADHQLGGGPVAAGSTPAN